MSDVFGQDDNTASGGLQSDMPGIGAAAPKPSQVPSALGGLASAFKQMFGGGRPAPMPATPGASPFQSPGQSQIPQQPNQPRMSGTVASLAIPKGGPQPPAKFTPFIASRPRDFPQWGQAEPFPALPQSFEVPSIYRGLSEFFGSSGGSSQLALPLALGMGRYAGDFIKGLQQGQEFKAKMARQQMEDHAYALEEQQKEEMTAYSDVFNQYAELSGTTDPAQMVKPINGVGLMDALHNQAAQIGDDKMTAMIENGATVTQIMRFQADREARLRDLSKANTASKDQTAQDELWGLTPPTQQPGGPGALGQDPAAQFGRPSQPATAAAPGAAADPGAAPPSLQPTQPNATGQVAGPGAPSTPDQAAPDTPIQEGATQIFKGYEPGTYVPADVKNAMALQANRMRARANTILNDPNVSADQVIPEVRKQLGAQVADDLANYRDYKRGPGVSGQATGGKEQDYWNLLGDLARKSKPGDPANNEGGWNAANFQAQQRFRTSTQVQQATGRQVTVATSGTQLDQALHALPEDASNPDAFARGIQNAQGQWGADRRYVAVNAAWLRYNQEVTALIRGGGGSVTEEEAARLTVPPVLGSPADYRVVVQQDAQQAIDRIRQNDVQWKGMGGEGHFPGYNDEAFQQLVKLANTQPDHDIQPGKTIKGDDGVTRMWMGTVDKDTGKPITEDNQWQTIR